MASADPVTDAAKVRWTWGDLNRDSGDRVITYGERDGHEVISIVASNDPAKGAAKVRGISGDLHRGFGQPCERLQRRCDGHPVTSIETATIASSRMAKGN